MATLYIRLFSKAAADSAEHWSALPCQFALADSGGGRGGIEREGFAPLTDLADAVARAQRVVLILAASDVTLLSVKVPPMSAARLKAALPNLVEDQLITDPADCTMVAGPAAGGVRTVAIVQRAWLEILSTTMNSIGARQIAAVPAQLCLPFQSGLVSAAITRQHADIDLTVRLSELEGIGLPIVPDSPELAAHDVLETLLAVVPQAPITLYVPPAEIGIYQDAARAAQLPEERIGIFDDDWSRWIAAVDRNALDLMPGLGKASGPQLNWRPWRWPLALAGMVLAVNVAAVNIDWWRMKNEADTLRANMTQIYRSAYPQDTVIVDPLAQMRQKMAAAKNEAGQAAPDDFTALSAAFGEAWNSLGNNQTAGQPQPDGIAAIEYRERSLFVRLKPGIEAPTERMQTALAARHLSLAAAPSSSTSSTSSPPSAAVVWQIRSAK